MGRGRSDQTWMSGQRSGYRRKRLPRRNLFRDGGTVGVILWEGRKDALLVDVSACRVRVREADCLLGRTNVSVSQPSESLVLRRDEIEDARCGG